ncbi:MAG TPA: NAD(P)/FAD-dependent oxidoreductase [Acidimicrobiales bacterium]|nr:NAD(P)/FAD-dependent oxidoreductase [Acidimicrobiales bacterium]
MSLAAVDAVVVGAGHNGLVAANLLADAGWEVLVLEAQPEPGGAVRSAELIRPGFVHDLFSAFYPLAAASPVLQRLDLESFGLRWRRAPRVLAHPTPDGRCAVLSTDIEETARSLDTYAAGDGDAWRRLYREWRQTGDGLVGALLAPFPPVLPAVELAARLGPTGLLRFARRLTLPARRFAEEEFGGAGGGLLVAGNTLHTDLSPEAAGGTLIGWLLSSLGQQHGFPVPEGGAGQLVAALVRRLESRGGRVECGARVVKVDVRGGRAVGVVTADGTQIGARRAVLADVVAPQLFLELVGPDHLADDFLEDLRRFQFDDATVKVDWALDGPIPWEIEGPGGAGTVHLADSMDELTLYSAELATGQLPRHPFLVLGQMTTADPTRSPPGTETAWAYTHVPRRPRGDAAGELEGTWGGAEAERFADRMEARIERFAPGFGQRVVGRHVFTPRSLAQANESLVDGSVNAGTAHLHQQLVFRPVPGLARPETPVRALYLASASAHPGGGVHGAPGANAARAAVAAAHRGRRVLAVAATGAVAAAARRRRVRARP